MPHPLFLQTAPLRLNEFGSFVDTFWPVLLPLALGLAAIYLLLPRARRYPPLWGGTVAGLALAAAAWFLIRAEMDRSETILFYSFAGLAVAAGGMMLTLRNPVHAALSFALVVLSSCGVFLLNAAPFLMAATIIIYAGAIVVTFLFVIMLAQQEGLSSADQRTREPFLATIAGFVLLGALLCVLHRTYDTAPLDDLLAQIHRAREAQSIQTVRTALGDYKEFKKSASRIFVGDDGHAVRAFGARAEFDQALKDLDEPLHHPDANLVAIRRALAEVYRTGVQVRVTQGALLPDEKLPLSPFSGARASDRLPVDEQGAVQPRLPAANVSALGRSLFSDYLLAVELAGVLLLVATIGAIAIAGRRTEVLR